MGRIFSGNGNQCKSVVGETAATAFLLFPQGDSAGKFRSEIALSSFSPRSFSSLSRPLEGGTDDADTGLVTFAVYECAEGGRAGTRSAKMTPRASQADRAGSRAVQVEAQKIQAPAREHLAGCETGKGAFELTVRSLARREYVCGSKDFMSAFDLADGSERNRVKC
jgi:hypothetical protein